MYTAAVTGFGARATTATVALPTIRALAVRIWIDMTAPAHVLVFRPIVQRLRARGHDVALTARDYSQTVELLGMHGLDAEVFGRHGGASRREKVAALARRTRAM